MDAAQTIQKFKSEYDLAVSRDEKIAKLDAAAKTAMEKYRAASKIAERTGMTTSQVLISNLLELYPDGNIPEDAAKALIRPALEHNHKYVSEKAIDAQAAMNEAAEVGLAPLASDFDARQADAVVEKLTTYDDISAHQRDIEKQIVASSRKTVDDTMRINAEAHQNAGMEVSVTRIYDGIGVHRRKDKCFWCLSRCGNDMPYREAFNKGAFERHPGCGCEIFYKTGKSIQRQTDWQNNTWEDAQDRDILDARKRANIQEQDIDPRERNIISAIISQFNEKTSDTLVGAIIENHEALKDITPEKMKHHFEDAGYTISPLGRGRLMGIEFEKGGGYRVTFGGDGYLQYHPDKGSHHNGAYWKVSNGKQGAVRYNLDGTKKSD